MTIASKTASLPAGEGLDHDKKRDKLFHGKGPLLQLISLLEEGRVPMNVSEHMELRTPSHNSDEQSGSLYSHSYFHTGDAVAYHPDGRFKVVLDSQHMREIDESREYHEGALVLTEKNYDSIRAEEFSKIENLEINVELTKEAAKKHPAWLILSRDAELLSRYVDRVFASSNYDTAMPIFLAQPPIETPVLRPLLFSGFPQKSSLNGEDFGFRKGYGRFIGVRE